MQMLGIFFTFHIAILYIANINEKKMYLFLLLDMQCFRCVIWTHWYFEV